MSEKSSTKPVHKEGMARLIEIAGTKKGLVILSAVLSAGASIASFVPYLAIYFVMRELLWVYPDFSLLDVDQTMRYGWFALIGIGTNIVLYFGALMCSHMAAFGTLYTLKLNFASHVARLPLGFHLNYGSGKIRKIMDENIEKIEGFIAHQIPDLVASIVAPMIMFIILMSVDWRYGIATIIGVIIAFLIQMKAYGNEGSKVMMEKYQIVLEEMNSASVEYIRGISVVKAFKQTVYSFRRLHETIKRYTGFVIPFTLSWENYMSGFSTLVNHLYLFIVPVGIYLGIQTTDYREYALRFMFYLLFVPSISTILMKVMYVSSNAMQIHGGVKRMDEVLAIPQIYSSSERCKINHFDIRFDQVVFSYTEQDLQALRNVSFCAKQGEITAIVGPSGSGKSTIAHLIPRFYDVKNGRITIGGIDLRDIPYEDLLELVSFVFQDVFLFKQTIMENIRIGNLSATDEQVIEAAKAAQCHHFIEKLPQGYQTVIGTKSVHLSGGEKQRIAIARAIVKDSPIIVLDEATAFADPENEYLIQKAFEKLMKGRTVIIIAHRLSTVRNAKHIVVMDHGVVAEEGIHDHLIEKDGKYRMMWDKYTQSIDWKIHKEEEGRC